MGTLLTGAWDDFQNFFGLNGHTTADTAGMNSAQAQTAANAATMKNAGMLTAVFGGLTSAIGSFYQAKTQQYQEKSQASSDLFQANMDAINAREAETSAQSIQEAGKAQVQQYTMRAAQEQASQTVGAAARGVDLSSASEVDQRASNEVVKDIDVMTINSNATRAAWAQRTQATNYSNQALLARASGVNLNTSASTISPVMSGLTSLMGSASQFASKWDYTRQIKLAAAGGSVGVGG